MTDIKPIMATVKRNELSRCSSPDGVNSAREGQDYRSITKLADLNKPGRPQRPSWMHLMAHA